MQSIVKEAKNIEYLKKAFKGLPSEKKDGLLDITRQLFKIQNNTTLKNQKRKIKMGDKK